MTAKEIANEILHYPQTESTIVEMMEEYGKLCFDAARKAILLQSNYGDFFAHQYPTFHDFINQTDCNGLKKEEL